VTQQFLAQRNVLRRGAVPDDEPGRGAAARVNDREFPGAEALARQAVGGEGGCVVDGTLLDVWSARGT
jgi:hypothetical protein